MDLLRDLLAGLRLGSTARRLRERADDGPAREVDLEGVVPEPLGLAQDQIGRLGKRRLAGAAAAQRGLGLDIPPGLVRDAAEREARLPDGVALELEADRDGDERERIGQAITDLEIGVIRRVTSRRQLDRSHELVSTDAGVALPRIAG